MTELKIAAAVMFTGIVASLLSTGLGSGLVSALLLGLFA